METSAKARVLVVEDDPIARLQLKTLLEKRDYLISAPEGGGDVLSEASQKEAKDFRPHVAIVDLRLDHGLNDDQSGLDLVKALRPARVIVYSAYLTREVVYEGLKKAGAYDLINKADDPHVLLDAVHQAACEVCATWRKIEFHRSKEYEPIQILSKLKLDSSLPAEAHNLPDDIIAMLFPDDTQIFLGPIGSEPDGPYPVSRGHSFVAQARLGDRLVPQLIKITSYARIEKESENYKKYIEDNIQGNFVASLDRAVSFYDLGGATYRMLGVNQAALPTALPTFSTYFRKSSPISLIKPLERFFMESWKGLYKKKQSNSASVYCQYDQIFHLSEKIRRSGEQAQIIRFPGIATDMPNPIVWVRENESRSYLLSPVFNTTTHGDLHGDNLLTDGNYLWAIDFERSGPGHILRDFVELEVDIITRLMRFSEIDLGQFMNFAIEVVRPSKLGEKITFIEPKNHPQNQVIRLINRLRALAHELTGSDNQLEYNWALLLDALYVSFHYPTGSMQQVKALLLASVLCSQIEKNPQENSNIHVHRHSGQEQHTTPLKNGAKPTRKTTELNPPDTKSILLVTATKVETEAVLRTFTGGDPSNKLWAGNKTYYALGKPGQCQSELFLVQSEMGTSTPGGSSITIFNAIQELQPHAIILCGIAYGLKPDKQNLGDILISQRLLCLESQKVDNLHGQIPRGDRSTASERLLDRFNDGNLNWIGAKVCFGLILSGEKLVNNLSYRQQLLEVEPEAIGGEMEGVGLYTVARDAKIDWIVVKAICDWADGNKNDNYQSLAAHNAANFIFHVLKSGGL